MRIGVLGPVGALLLTALAAWGPERAGNPEPLDPPTCARAPHEADDAASCGRCHAVIHDEWTGTAHARAWTDEVYQAALRERKEPELCHSCHIPTGVHGRLGRPPRTRTENLHDGVGCAACHVTRSGIAGPFGADAGDAHGTVEHPAFNEQGSNALCASCHDLRIGPVLPLARDFRAAELGKRRKSCIGCHMARVERPIANRPGTDEPSGPARNGRSHRLKGPSDPEFVASAFKLRVTADDTRPLWTISLGNRAGHRVPGLLSRVFEFELTPVDGRGGALGEPRTLRIDADNPLRVAETRRFHVPRVARAAKMRVVGRHVHGDETPVVFLETEIGL